MLVDYGSDSDSDSPQSPPPPAPPPAAAPSKPPSSGIPGLNLPKPKNRLLEQTSSGAKKIVVSLPKPSAEDDTDGADDVSGPPSKRARTAGGFADLSALLPKPKGRAQAEGERAREEPKKRVLGGGAARKEDWLVDEYDGGNGVDGGSKEASVETLEPDKDKDKEKEKDKPEIKGDATMFKPSTVGRRTIQPMSAFRKKPAGTAAKPKAAYKPAAPPEPKKIDLFGAGPAVDTAPTPSKPPTTSSDYQPLLHIPTPEPTAPPPSTSTTTSPNAPPSDPTFSHLTPSDLRQLFGRRQPHDLSSIPMATFSVDAEYARNQRAIETGAAEQPVAPVRAIAGGRHQLTSLLSNAQAQREALEEQISRGKRNRRDAGNRYGW